MVNAALDFDVSIEDLEKPLFFSDRDCVRTMWEYRNMVFQDMSKEILEAYEHSQQKMLELNDIQKNFHIAYQGKKGNDCIVQDSH